jgi:hypothetical protein
MEGLMYCAECGFSLPSGAKFCPRCCKRNVLDAAAGSGSIPDQSPPQGEEAMGKDGKTLEPSMDEQSVSIPASATPETSTKADDASPAASSEPSPAVPKVPPQYVNSGSIILGVVALICVVLCAIQGFIPIFLIEGVAFGGLAWLCAARWPLSPLLHSIVFVSSLLLAGLVGVTLDQDTFGPRYRYLSQGSVQYRVDEKAGRTDRLANGGWYPVAFDREAQKVPENGNVPPIELTQGGWTSSLSPLGGKICFSATNSSDYIVERVEIVAHIQKKSDAEAGKNGATNLYARILPNSPDYPRITLKNYGGGFIGARESAMLCASSPRDLSADETWSYTYMGAYGWKR